MSKYIDDKNNKANFAGLVYGNNKRLQREMGKSVDLPKEEKKLNKISTRAKDRKINGPVHSQNNVYENERFFNGNGYAGRTNPYVSQYLTEDANNVYRFNGEAGPSPKKINYGGEPPKAMNQSPEMASYYLFHKGNPIAGNIRQGPSGNYMLQHETFDDIGFTKALRRLPDGTLVEGQEFGPTINYSIAPKFTKGGWSDNINYHEADIGNSKDGNNKRQYGGRYNRYQATKAGAEGGKYVNKKPNIVNQKQDTQDIYSEPVNEYSPSINRETFPRTRQNSIISSYNNRNDDKYRNNIVRGNNIDNPSLGRGYNNNTKSYGAGDMIMSDAEENYIANGGKYDANEIMRMKALEQNPPSKYPTYPTKEEATRAGIYVKPKEDWSLPAREAIEQSSDSYVNKTRNLHNLHRAQHPNDYKTNVKPNNVNRVEALSNRNQEFIDEQNELAARKAAYEEALLRAKAPTSMSKNVMRDAANTVANYGASRVNNPSLFVDDIKNVGKGIWNAQKASMVPATAMMGALGTTMGATMQNPYVDGAGKGIAYAGAMAAQIEASLGIAGVTGMTKAFVDMFGQAPTDVFEQQYGISAEMFPEAYAQFLQNSLPDIQD